jgi:hypothetical protein
MLGLQPLLLGALLDEHRISVSQLTQAATMEQLMIGIVAGALGACALGDVLQERQRHHDHGADGRAGADDSPRPDPVYRLYQDTPTSNLTTHSTFRPRTLGVSANCSF